ncbi:hypothetical protein ACSBR1_027462 [Camellia fascicularis]
MQSDHYPKGHVSKSIYANATFRLVNAPPTSGSLLGEFLPNLSLAIWTITPWTIPANVGEIRLIAEIAPTVGVECKLSDDHLPRAITPLWTLSLLFSFFLYSMNYYCRRNMAYCRNCTDSVAVNSKLQYAVVEVHALLGDASTSPGDRKKRLGNVLKEQNKHFLIITSDLLSTLEAKWGTKLVVKKILMGSDLEHCRYIHPIDSRECPVIIGGDYITTESGTGLVHTAPGHEHKYPYDWWRTKKPTIFRATEQWFASVEGFREAAMDAISQVTFLSQAENRISAMTSSHSDWCISRQRTWGVPIPVFYHVESKEPLLNENIIDHIQSIICQKGSDAWWYMTVDELLPDVYRDKASEYEKGTDTMDAWFDSGSSWAAVLEKRSGLSFPADLYLEGTDQHRGWFQSSLLTSITTKGKAPYFCVIMHGFGLDERG